MAPNHYQCPPNSPSSLKSKACKLYSNLPVKCHMFELAREVRGDDLGANITNCQYIGSYNWVSDRENLSIIVPGSPREWREQQLPCAVPPDIQGHHRDQYDHRMRSTPLLPLLLAVNYWYERARLQPLKFHWHDIDFVTNRNSLRHLLRMLRADANRAAGKGGTNGGGAHGGRECNRGNFKYPNSQSFRIDIELAGTKTIVLSPWEPDTFEPCLADSYGLNFEYAFTREADAVSSLDSAGGSGRHHRINSYDFGGLQMVVQSEIDACLPFPHDNEGVTVNIQTSQIPSTSQSHPSHPSSTSLGLTIIPSCNPPTPQTHLIELSTIRDATFPTWNAKERYPQLYFAQVPNHYLASHTNGTINHINKRNLYTSPEILFYAPGMEPHLRRLRRLLGRVQAVVVNQAHRSRGRRKSFSLVYSHGKLALYERVGKRRLPDGAFDMFNV